jgi:predicted glycosyltransferase involved in capsule biosynthesis
MQTSEKITLVIPIRLTGATHEGALRLARICDAVPRDLFDILISDYGTAPEHRLPLEAAEREGAEVVRHPAPHKLFSIGRARDFGVQMSRSRVIVFNDIDFLGTEAMYRAIHAEAVRRDLGDNLLDFFCVPVLFLTEAGTRDWLAAADGDKPFSRDLSVDALEADRGRIQSVAYGSSAMVINRHHYLTLGGHDPRFTGHGAEDYDLLHRLAALAPKGPRPHDYYTDYKDNNVRRYWGFRPLFALYGLDLLPRGIHLVHLWHPRRKERGYFRPGRNFRLLGRVMKRFDRSGAQPLPLGHLAGAGGRWLVLHRDRADIDLLRQVLPLGADYRLLKARNAADALRRLASADMSDVSLVLAAPGARIALPDIAGALPATARMLSLSAPDAGGTVKVLDAVGHAVAEGSLRAIRAPDGRHLMTVWNRLELPGLSLLASGSVPGIEDADAPLFASFGRDEVLSKHRSRRPARRKKSPFWVRMWRWATRS